MTFIYRPRYGGSPNMDLCRANVMDGFHGSQCSRAVKVERDGVGYCAQHDPVAVQARRDDWDRKFRAKMDAQQQALDHSRALAAFKCEAVEALRQIADGYNDARGLALEIMAKEPKEGA